MKNLLYTGIFALMMFTSLYAQGFGYSRLQSKRVYDFVIPSFTMKVQHGKLRSKSILQNPVILKSPIVHKAIFCRLEDLTQKKLGIMIQFHTGDYNSRMDFVVPR